ncbi:MAG: tetratricopeptide repeat protein [Acidobacteriota bacterium]
MSQDEKKNLCRLYNDEQLENYLNKTLPEEDVLAIDEHLSSGCEDCWERLGSVDQNRSDKDTGLSADDYRILSGSLSFVIAETCEEDDDDGQIEEHLVKLLSSTTEKRKRSWESFIEFYEYAALITIRRALASKGVENASKTILTEILMRFFATIAKDDYKALREFSTLMYPLAAMIRFFATNVTLQVINERRLDTYTNVDPIDSEVLTSSEWQEAKKILSNLNEQPILVQHQEANHKEAINNNVPVVETIPAVNSTSRHMSRRKFAVGLAAGIIGVTVGGRELWVRLQNDQYSKYLPSHARSGSTCDNDHSTLICHDDFDTCGVLKYASNGEWDQTLKSVFTRAESALIALKTNPNDPCSLFDWAEWLEGVGLLPEAEESYVRVLTLGIACIDKVNVQKRLDELRARIKTCSQKKTKTRYDLLQESIDEYLTARQLGRAEMAEQAIAEAQRIAEEMLNKTEERFGIDLIAFYQNLPQSKIAKIQMARGLVREVEINRSSDNYGEFLVKAKAAKHIFLEAEAELETFRCDYYITYYLDKSLLYKVERAVLLKKNLALAPRKKYLLFYGLFKDIECMHFATLADFTSSIQSLKSSLDILKPLEVPFFYMRSLIRLSNSYWVHNDNVNTIKCSYEALIYSTTWNMLGVSLLHNIGISAFTLGFRELAYFCMNKGLDIADQKNSLALSAYGLSYLGVMYAEEGFFDKAKTCITKIFSQINKIRDLDAHRRTRFTCLGYAARIMALSGNYDDAIELYDQALKIVGEIEFHQICFLSHLHKGLAECLLAKKDCKSAKKEMEIAVDLYNKAMEKFQTINNLLTVAVTRKDCREQLKIIKECSFS